MTGEQEGLKNGRMLQIFLLIKDNKYTARGHISSNLQLYFHFIMVICFLSDIFYVKL